METKTTEETPKKNYRIGLDIGIASVGWAVLENNSQDEPIRILDLGVRIFDVAEVPKTGAALAEGRRNARTTRRRLRRRRHRLERIRWLFEKEGLIRAEEFMKRYQTPGLPDVYELRYQGLDRKLSDEEFAQVLYHLAKHRGFRSTGKAELKEGDNGKVLKATEENLKLMEEKGYRTVGEMLYLDENFRTLCDWEKKGYVLTPRNKPDDYKHTMKRDLLEDEVKVLFETQRRLGNDKASKELEEKYLDIMLSQRSFDMGPGLQADGTPSPYAMQGFQERMGKCTFEDGEYRAAKATYTAELFVALQKINHLKLTNMDGKTRPLAQEERELILEMLQSQKEVKYAAVRKKLNLPQDVLFNSLTYNVKNKQDATTEERIKKTENTTFVSMLNTYEYRKRLGSYLDTLSEEEQHDLFDKIGTILTCYKNDNSRMEEFSKINLEPEAAEKLLELTPAKTQRLSIKAMKKILPYLMEGLTYDKACEKAGYDFKNEKVGEKSKLLKGEHIIDAINAITNPVVKRSVSQTVKVINAIIKKYGSPQAINIEMAREMSKNRQERDDMEKRMKANQERNESAKKEIQELGIAMPKGQDILKYRLWLEQDGICMYTGEKIPLERLFHGGYDIDHILPYSITFDDSFQNKVLVTSQANREKGNRIPFEYLGKDADVWNHYVTRVNAQIKDDRKRRKLLKKEFTQEERKEFKKRNLNDTRYITTVVHDMLLHNLEFAPYSRPEKKKKVITVNGVVTDYLKKRWGLPKKDRSTDTHHAMDAVVVACCTDGMIRKISRSTQYREILYRGKNKPTYQPIDAETGELLDIEELSREKWDELYGAQIPRPWQYFKEELEIRMGEDPQNFIETHKDVYQMLQYPDEMLEDVHPIFVSKMSRHKITGAAHKDTVRSMRHYEEGGEFFEESGYVLSRTPLESLKLKDGEIVNYYNKESDLLLYNALKARLLEFDGNAKKAFEQPFYKPKADGTPGPIVKKVKLYEKMTIGVPLNGKKGIAANDGMVRVDIFREDGKYYFVPVYISDVVKKQLPMKAVKQNKPYSQWKEMKDENFLFSLYSRDLIEFVHPTGKKATGVHGEEIVLKKAMVYYMGADINTASIIGVAHDKSYNFKSLGVQSLEELKKYHVDVLGNITEVKQEKRMGFS